MKRPRVKRNGATGAPRRKKRLTVSVDESIARKAATCATSRGLNLGDVVQEALEAHLRGFYWVDPRDGAPTVEASAAA